MNKMLENLDPITVLTADGGSYQYTPENELVRLALEARNAAVRDGIKPYTVDEMLKALEEERAGYDGLGRLWKKSNVISIQV